MKKGVLCVFISVIATLFAVTIFAIYILNNPLKYGLYFKQSPEMEESSTQILLSAEHQMLFNDTIKLKTNYFSQEFFSYIDEEGVSFEPDSIKKINSPTIVWLNIKNNEIIIKSELSSLNLVLQVQEYLGKHTKFGYNEPHYGFDCITQDNKSCFVYVTPPFYFGRKYSLYLNFEDYCLNFDSLSDL